MLPTEARLSLIVCLIISLFWVTNCGDEDTMDKDGNSNSDESGDDDDDNNDDDNNDDDNDNSSFDPTLKTDISTVKHDREDPLSS